MGRFNSCAAAKVATAAVVLRTHSRSSGPWLALHARSRLQPVAKWLMPSSSVMTSACSQRAPSAARYDKRASLNAGGRGSQAAAALDRALGTHTLKLRHSL